jgi:hypothetical protein
MATSEDLAAADKRIADAKADLVRTETLVAIHDHGYSWWSTTNAMTMSAVVLIFGKRSIFPTTGRRL